MNACVIIPAHNEAETIGEVVQEARKYADKVLVIDDGSTDNTAEIARENGAEVVHHWQNRGPGAALQSGYDAAISSGVDYVVQVDGDRQHNPRYIPDMLEAVQGCDMVIASRFLNDSYRHYPLVRRWGISFFTFLVNRLGRAKLTDITSGYRAYRTEGLRRLGRSPDGHWAVEQTLRAARKGLGITEISIEMPPRNAGESQFSLKTYAMYPFRMMWVILKVMLSR
jgi:glycosyltransferase involved in cell wall biosynthesis